MIIAGGGGGGGGGGTEGVPDVPAAAMDKVYTNGDILSVV